MSDKIHQENVSRVFPRRWPVASTDDRAPNFIEITDGQATGVFDALSSETARLLLSQLHEKPQTASDLAATVDTSLQNVHYHLNKFRDIGLIEVVDHWYSTRGTEMKVYGPADQSLVLYTGESPSETPLREVLVRALGGVAILALAGLLVDRVVSWLTPRAAAPTGQRLAMRFDGGEAHRISETPGLEIAGQAVTPGLVFFVGGLFMLLLGLAWWSWQN